MVGLVMLGVGWNFMFVGATALLATSHAPHERLRAQTANDVIVFGTVACTAFLSGYAHARFGWAAMNMAVLPTLLAAAALLLWQARKAGVARAA